VIAESSAVRVTVTRAGLPTWFARMFGPAATTVSARATAQGVPAQSATCVKPFAPPDLWHDADDDTNGNGYPDGNEEWILADNPADYYSAWTGNAQAYPPQTGWGSNMRNSDFDYGQQIVIKATDSGGSFHAGWFYPWIDPGGELLQLCEYDSGGDAGASAY